MSSPVPSAAVGGTGFRAPGASAEVTQASYTWYGTRLTREAALIMPS
ncbi:hypothetical protein M271_26330 [Streptomyces rapamycinicus NRRL 5491]|uniref:Uncharacterized protein n=1 Tax=Streptomyces iranensis TaxID=576784 RepID=A0A060ZR55_9ACTN|nr:hypothetical protein M271_26330 [Streptomyces rapamycinicus NRRL 5491]CDR08662.1 predicted protein [Streptomyces iranensis]